MLVPTVLLGWTFPNDREIDASKQTMEENTPEIRISECP